MKRLSSKEMSCIHGGLSGCAKAWWGLGLSSIGFVSSLVACGAGVATGVGIAGIYLAEVGIGTGVAAVGTNC